MAHARNPSIDQLFRHYYYYMDRGLPIFSFFSRNTYIFLRNTCRFCKREKKKKEANRPLYRSKRSLYAGNVSTKDTHRSPHSFYAFITKLTFCEIKSSSKYPLNSLKIFSKGQYLLFYFFCRHVLDPSKRMLTRLYYFHVKHCIQIYPDHK